MSRVVRSSKYRHIFGKVHKKEDCYDDLKVTRSAWDSNFITANGLYFATILESGGGGAFAVIPHTLKGKVDPKLPTVTGHKSPVLDIDFNPFNDSLIASVSEDCTGKIWGIPSGGLTANMNDPLQTLNGHKRKIGCVKFNPTANNILATAASDFAVKVWDIEKGKDVLSLEAQHGDLIQSIDWNYNGSLLATSCKDKKIRILDPRQQTVISENLGHEGVKGIRVCFLGKSGRLFTSGFTKTSEREFAIWDPRDFSKPLNRTNLDASSGVIIPLFDPDTNVLFLAGKGDGNIRYYEIVDEDPYIHYLTEFKSATPLRGACLLPKRYCDISANEIDRVLKLSTKAMEPISMEVPRKSDVFQDDIFPDTFSGEPSTDAGEWLSGKNGDIKLTSLAPGFVQKERATDFKPTVQQEKVLSESELKAEVEKLTKRVFYLKAELVKRDQKIKELSS